jgi:hypothetical protein
MAGWVHPSLRRGETFLPCGGGQPVVGADEQARFSDLVPQLEAGSELHAVSRTQGKMGQQRDGAHGDLRTELDDEKSRKITMQGSERPIALPRREGALAAEPGESRRDLHLGQPTGGHDAAVQQVTKTPRVRFGHVALDQRAGIEVAELG